MAAQVPPSGTPKSGDPLASPAATKINEVEQKPDYLNLPCPGNYEEIHREAWGALKPEFIEGLRFDFSKGITPSFVLSHSVTMGPMEFPSPSPEPIKVPTANYEFGAHVGTPKVQLNGRVTTDGRLMGRAVYGLTSDVSLRASLQLGNEPHGSTGFLNIDYKGNDYRSLLQLGSGGLVGASYIQSVTPNLQLGGELAWVGQHRRAMLNYAARYETNKMVATGQVFSSGMVILTYFQKVSEKVSLATDFMYNPSMRDVTASAGYDYIFRNGRLRGKIDSNGCVGALLEERLSNGLNFLLSGELDHRRKDYRFGYGLTIG